MNQLAIHGGNPVFPEGPPVWPVVEPGVQAALLQTYQDGSWGKYHGPHCAELASTLGQMHGTEFVTLCSSGTIAVELALRGLQVGAGDEVVLAGYDFPGNFRAVESVGARPVLVDIRPETLCLDEKLLEASIGKETRAVIVSHLHSGTANMPRLVRFARQRGLAVLEDACQSPGARIGHQIAGTWGDVAVLSFGGSKLLTAGRGGAVITPEADIHQRMRVYSDRGNQAFPLSELQAAVLIPQLELLEQRNKTRRENAQRLLRLLTGTPGLQPVDTCSQHDWTSYYKLAWLLTSDHLTERRDDLLAAFQGEGLAIDAGFRGFARRSDRRCRRASGLNHSAWAGRANILLHHPVLLESPTTMDRVAEGIHKVIMAFTQP
ncbi:MAG: perosamine synthetase [Planctomycetaceae bacterium]|nr:perosamine synthetase [Planctomycetaceae bacterium]MBP60841.1 perosamine synthetase [Planctomycetaceae bacterium]